MKRRTQRYLARHLPEPDLEANAAKVRAEILTAWMGDAPPGSIPPHCQRPDCPAIAAYFSGKTWQDVRIHEMRTAAGASADDVLPFLTPAAFRHFLAAFLLAFLDDPSALGNFAAPLVGSLCPSAGWRELVGLLSPEQQRAVLSFLRHAACARHGGPHVDEGIRFWERRTTGARWGPDARGLVALAWRLLRSATSRRGRAGRRRRAMNDRASGAADLQETI